MTEMSSLGWVPSGFNYIQNPCFEVNQRGVASVSATGYVVDRWKLIITGTACVASQQSFTLGQTDVPGEPKNYLRTVVTSSAGTGNRAFISEIIEDVRTLAGRIATLSFYAKADAAKPIAIEGYQYFGSGGSPSSAVFFTPQKITLSTSWTRYTLQFAIPSISGKTIGTDLNTSCINFTFWMDAGSDFNARTNSLGQQSGTFDIANVKLEEGSVATPFIVPRYADELQKCMRYLQPLGTKTAANENISANGVATNTTVCGCPVALNPQMRTTPTLITPTSYANFQINDGANTVALSQDPVISAISCSRMVTIICAVASGLTQYRPYKLGANNQTTDAMYLSAEL